MSRTFSDRASFLAAPALAAAGLLAVTAAPASAQLVYTSNGFESTAGFFPGFQLAGQTGGTPPLEYQSRVGSSDPQISVQAGIGELGTNAASLAYGTGGVAVDNFVTVPTPIDTDANRFVSICFTLNVPVQPDGFGPIFSVEAIDDGSDGTSITAIPSRVGGFGVDSTDGAVVVLVPDTGPDAAPGDLVYSAIVDGSGALVTAGFNEYHAYELVLDYLTETYDVFFDGAAEALVEDLAFITPGASFTNAQLSQQAGDVNPAVGYFDKFEVAVVPEPASAGFALSAVAATGMLRRRRR